MQLSVQVDSFSTGASRCYCRLNNNVSNCRQTEVEKIALLALPI